MESIAKTERGPKKNWRHLGHGIHICGIYRDKDEQFESVLPFFKGGAANAEKCMYLYEKDAPKIVYEEFARTLETDNLFERGQMEMHHFPDVYLKNGDFDPQGVVGTFEKTVEATLYEGYTGFRAVGEMTGILERGVPLERYIEYEVLLNDFYPFNKVTGICLFDENRFLKEFLADMIQTHPYILLYGKLYQNRHFFIDTSPLLGSEDAARTVDYDSMLATILEDEPLIA